MSLTVIIILAISAVLTLALGWLSVRYASWIKEKIKSARVEGILLRLGDAVFKVVRELQQTVVDKAKEDGEWNKEKAEEVKKAAITKIKEYLGPKGIKEALTILGLDSSGLDKLLGTMIESDVFDLRGESTEDAAA
jgi:hypothetical protein